MIKLAPVARAYVSEDFKDLVNTVARRQVEAIKTECLRFPRNRMNILQQNAPKLRSASAVLKDMDGVVTKLRLLNGFSSFSVYEYNNITYFFAHTKTVTLSDGGRESIRPATRHGEWTYIDHPPIWDMGEYDVYIPQDIFSVRNLNHFNFVPVRAPLDGRRHVHHHAKFLATRDGSDLFMHNGMYESELVKHPLDLEPRTCWGGFNTVVASVLNEMDVIELFRNIWIYLNRHNAGSPLVHIEDISFKVAL